VPFMKNPTMFDINYIKEDYTNADIVESPRPRIYQAIPKA